MHNLHTTVFCTLLTCGLVAQTIVIPNGFTATEGTSSTAYPWGRGTNQIRVLYVYDSNHFLAQGVNFPIVVTQLRWRANGGATGGTGTYNQVDVSMSTAAVDYTGVVTTFASNHGGDLQQVWSGPVTVAPGAGTAPNNWYVDVVLTAPFVYDPNLGDLAIDIATDASGWVGAVGPAMDSAGAAGNTARVYNLSNWQSPTGTRQVGSSPIVEVTYSTGSGIATATAFGQGCPSANPTTLSASARPVTGTTIQLVTTNVAAGTVLGAQLYGLVAFAPPIDLTPLGMPGCFQHQSAEVTVLVLGGAPTFSSPFAVPSNTAFSGVVIQTQSATLTPGANPQGALTSNGLTLTLGTS